MIGYVTIGVRDMEKPSSYTELLARWAHRY